MMMKDPRNLSRLVPQLEQVDDHLTVYMGISLDDIRVQGHVFVELAYYGPVQSHPNSFREMSDRYKTHTLLIKGKLPGHARQYVQAGHGYWSEEFYEHGNALSNNQHNHEIQERYLARYPPGTKLRQDLL